MAIDPRVNFPHFYGNKAIKVIANVKRWTVSGRLGDADSKGKAPLDIREFLDTGRIRGAWSTDARCLVTLNELTTALPNAANAAYYLRTLSDGFMVIDIEPTCPAEIAASLLRLPGIYYSELSMSGRGYHLVVSTPDNFDAFLNASNKRVLREEHGWYELLMEHWVTFTRNPVPDDVFAQAQNGDLASSSFTSVADLYESLAKSAKAVPMVMASTLRTDVPDSEIIGSEQIVDRTIEGAQPRLKELDHFGGDHSRWEFSILGTLHREMGKHTVRVGFLRRIEYSPSDQAILLYMAAVKVLPSRLKHYERRNGRPFLLDRAAAMVAANPLVTTRAALPNDFTRNEETA